MDPQRNLILIALLCVSFIIWQTWQVEKKLYSFPQTVQQSTDVISIANEMETNTTKQLIRVQTDVLSLSINTHGGDIEKANLLSYPNTLDSDQPFELLDTTQDFIYQAQSGLTGENGPDNPKNGDRPLFTTTKENFLLDENQDELCIPLTFISKEGIIFNKTFVLKRNDYAIKVHYQVKNNLSIPLELSLFGQLKQSINLPKYREIGSGNFALQTYRGAAYSSSDNKYKKYSFSDIEETNLHTVTKGGWVAMLQQYFATAWIPNSQDTNTFYSKKLSNNLVTIGFKSIPVIIPPGAKKDLSAILWIGPEIQDKMSKTADYLDLTVDYGWLWFISQPLFKLLNFIQVFIVNWGFSIIIITFIVRGIMYPLTKAQYTSMAKMRILQPKLTEIRERIGDDRQQMSKEMMELYKNEHVNPLGGCLPLLIQMPIFLALYYMLMNSVELRHASFILWINDLSAQDPYYILPIFMGITMYYIQKMSPTTITDPIQQKIMTFMPFIFTVFFLWFPSGLVLYYIVSNLVTILQQHLIFHSLERSGLHKRERK